MDLEPSIDELAARAWHEIQEYINPDHSEWKSSCWCCCDGCDPDWGGQNPYFERAAQAMRDETP